MKIIAAYNGYDHTRHMRYHTPVNRLPLTFHDDTDAILEFGRGSLPPKQFALMSKYMRLDRAVSIDDGTEPDRELPPSKRLCKYRKDAMLSGIVPFSRLAVIFRAANLVRLSICEGIGSIIFVEEISILVSSCRLPIVLGRTTWKPAAIKFITDSFESVQIEVGKVPLKQFIPMLISCRFDNRERLDGTAPDRQLEDTRICVNFFKHPTDAGRAPINLLALASNITKLEH
jgi:hypothetical protein